MARAAELLRARAEAAGAEGRATLTEDELLPALEALGFRVPRHAVVDVPEGDADERPAWAEDAVRSVGGVADPSDEPGTRRVVVKLLSPDVTHRTDVGGVVVVEASAAAVAEAVRRVAGGGPGRTGGAGPRRVLVAEYVHHDLEPGGELLLSFAYTHEFGPVVHVGLGGVTAETVAAAARPGALHTAVPAGEGAPAGATALLPSAGYLTDLATGALRGRAGRASVEDLARAVDHLRDLAGTLCPDPLVELELNPVAFVHGEPWVLDAVGRVGAPVPDVPADSPFRREALGALLHPGSVAVMGVSRGENPGRAILRNVLAFGMPPSSVQVVKPGLSSLDGCVCVPDIASLEPVDVLVLSVDAAQAPGVMEAVVEGGKARAVILIPGGLEEGGGSGGAAVREVLRRPGAPVVNGANCLGIRSVPGRFDTLFIPRYKLGFPEGPPDPVAVISQSGAFAIARVGIHPWLNPRYLLTLGTQLDLTVGEYLEHLLDDGEVRVFACYVEGFRPGDGARFLRAAQRARAEGRTVILYRGGRTPAGRDATASHTASLAGDYALTRMLAEQVGVLVADSLDDFDDLLQVSVRLDRRAVKGRRVGMVSNAGFECVALADALDELEPAVLSAATREALARILEEHRLASVVSPRNPLDLTPILSDGPFVEAARRVLEDPEVDIGVVGCVPLTPALQTLPAGQEHAEDLTRPEGIVHGLTTLWKATDKPWAAVVDSGARYDAFAGALTKAGLPVFRRADRATRALSRYVATRVD